MTTARQRQTHTHRRPAHRHISNISNISSQTTGKLRFSLLTDNFTISVSSRMFLRTLLLVAVAAIFCADAEDKSRLYRRPSCMGTSVTQACPLNYSPVCGSDGVTYPNECSLCVQRLNYSRDYGSLKAKPNKLIQRAQLAASHQVYMDPRNKEKDADILIVKEGPC